MIFRIGSYDLFEWHVGSGIKRLIWEIHRHAESMISHKPAFIFCDKKSGKKLTI
jgi:hypothetical protein